MPEELGLPLLRGNPFDLRPIESGREYLVGRTALFHLEGTHSFTIPENDVANRRERSSGRSSIVRTLASQTKKEFFVGQYWPMKDPVNSIIHELSIHFCGFEIFRSNRR